MRTTSLSLLHLCLSDIETNDESYCLSSTSIHHLTAEQSIMLQRSMGWHADHYFVFEPPPRGSEW